ncbi:MFS transporter [Brevibacterium zhoupengii]|uniref:MFS transporter n=1 Tax=Brevibacterium zhoupengii TaxID=2898795 RepID=UPI001F09CC58|nr:MFS transporter [Brevibacterium zhoupengii]
MPAAVLNVKTTIDESPMTPRRWLVIAACFVIALLDGFDTQSIAFVGSSIAEDFSMTTLQMTWIITGSTIGMTIGAITLGSVGDRIGRKNTLFLAMTIFGVFSVLGAFAQAPWQIVALRVLIGLGIGGATPSLLALAAEFSSNRHRGIAMTLVLLGLPGGALLGGVVAAAWLPVLGWRGIFLLGGVLPLLMILILIFCPESPTFLVAHGGERNHRRAVTLMRKMTDNSIPDDVEFVSEREQQTAGSIRSLFAVEYRATTIAVCLVYLANWVAWFLLLQWMPTALNELGLSQAQAASGTIIVNGAFIVFSFPISAALTRVRTRTLLLTMFGAGILIALGIAMIGSAWGLTLVLIALAGFGIGGQQLVLNYLVANAYPTQLRGTATGFSIGIGRLGSIVGSALGGWLLASFGVGGYFAAIALPLAVAAVATLLIRQPQPVFDDRALAEHSA